MNTVFRISSVPTTKPLIKKAAAGAMIGTALQLGQTLGEMMPDNVVGDGLKGVLNPMDMVGRSVDHFSNGKIGRGLLSLTPLGGFVDSHFKREEAAAAEKAAKEANYKTSFNNRVQADTQEAEMMKRGSNRISLYASGGKLNSVDQMVASANQSAANIPSSYGGSQNAPFSAPNSIGLGNNAEILTDSSGGVSGTHEGGQNVPIHGNGQMQAIAEPGEVLVNNPDGSATVLAKRNGLAQEYIKLENTKKQLIGLLNTAKDVAEQNGLKRKIAALEIRKNEVKALQDQLSAEIEASGQQEMVDPNGVPMAAGGVTIPPNMMMYNHGLTGEMYTGAGNAHYADVTAPYMSEYPVELRNNPNTPQTGTTTPTTSMSINNPYHSQMIGIKGRPMRSDAELRELTPEQVAMGVNPGSATQPFYMKKFDNPITTPITTPTQPTTTTKSKGKGSGRGTTTTTPATRVPETINGITPKGLNPVNSVKEGANTLLDTDRATPYSDAMKTVGGGKDWSKGLGVASDVAQMALPVVANIKAQRKMEEMMKKVNEYQPELLKTFRTPYKTEIGDQVAEVNNMDANNRRIAEMVSNPLTANAITSASGAQRINQLNPIHANAVNTDNRIKLQQDAMAGQNNAMNTQLINGAKEMKLNAALGKIRAEIDMNNQTVANIYTQIAEKNVKESDLLRMSLAMKHLNQYGVLNRKYADILKGMGIDIDGVEVTDK